ncbi:MAG: carbohydrate ABC transporter substrate-binding protein [Clostridia bacterium]|nr:carbohydrate ABC transporter substrate-binding protein [Clostridia bacterium]
MKRYVTALLALLLTTSFAGCVGDTTSDVSDSVGTSAGTEPLLESGELLIWYDTCSKDYMMGLITEFQRKYPGIEVITEDYSDMIIPDYRTKLAGELMAGGGPDIVLSNHDNNNIVQNLTKLLQNGIFLDVNTLGVDFSDCNQAVLSSGVYEGGQYMIPLNYSLGLMLTTEERIDTYNLVCDGDLLAFADSLKSIYDSGKYVFLDYFATDFLYRQNGMTLIDHANRDLTDDDDQKAILHRLADAYEGLFPDIFEDGMSVSYMFYRNLNQYNNSEIEAFLSGDLTFLASMGKFGALDQLMMIGAYSTKIMEAGETPYLTSLPTADGDASSPVVNWFLLVNGKTEHTDEAMCFIDSAVGMESQYLISSQLGIPVNNDLIECMRAYYCDGVQDAKYRFADHKLPEQVISYFFDQIDSMQPGVYTDVQTMGHLFGVFREYLTGSDFDVAYDHAKNNVSFYLSE